jgi:hypothetical protein
MSWNIKKNSYFFILYAVNFFINSIIATQEGRDFNQEAINGYQQEVDSLKGSLENSKEVGLKDRLLSITTPMGAATAFFAFLSLCDYYFTESQEKDAKDNIKKEKPEKIDKKKNYKENFEKKFMDSLIDRAIGLLYNELFLKESAPILNNQYLMEKYKKLELSDKIFKIDQAEGKLFGYTYGLLSSSEKTLKSFKNVIKRLKDVTFGALSLFIGFAVLKYEASNKIKELLTSQLDAIEKLNEKPMSKEILAVGSLLALDHYVISPLFESVIAGAISITDEYLNKKSTKVAKNMALGQMTRIVCSNPFTREERIMKDGSGKVQEKLQDDVKLFNDLIGIWKYSKTMYSIFKTIKKLI